MYNKQGVSLIELVVFIIIVSLIMVPLSVIIREALSKTVMPEHYSIASELARREMERFVTARTFNDVLNPDLTPANSYNYTYTGSYTGNFSLYSYQVNVCCVNSGNLTGSPAGSNTSYIRATITITRTGFPNVSLVTLITDNGDSF